MNKVKKFTTFEELKFCVPNAKKNSSSLKNIMILKCLLWKLELIKFFRRNKLNLNYKIWKIPYCKLAKGNL